MPNQHQELRERALTWLRGRRSDDGETEDIINRLLEQLDAMRLSLERIGDAAKHLDDPQARANIRYAVNRALSNPASSPDVSEREDDLKGSHGVPAASRSETSGREEALRDVRHAFDYALGYAPHEWAFLTHDEVRERFNVALARLAPDPAKERQ